MQLAGRILRVLFRNHFILVLLPKEMAAMNPERFVAGSVPLDWCTNICAGVGERQGGCGSDRRGRWSGGLLALARLEYGGASQPVWAPLSCAPGRGGGGCAVGQGVVQGGHDPTLAPGCHLIMPSGDLLVN